MAFWHCAAYLACISIAGFIAGRLLPGRWFHWDRFPYKTRPFEQDGRIYLKLRVTKWKDRAPDMSRIFPRLMPPKKLRGRMQPEDLVVMLRENCIAEMIHLLLIFAALPCIAIWPAGGTILFLAYAVLGNLPFIIIQRYNRPRLVCLYKRLLREDRK